MQSPFCCIKLFESELYPVCAADQQGKPIFDLTNSQAPLLDYTPTLIWADWLIVIWQNREG